MSDMMVLNGAAKLSATAAIQIYAAPAPFSNKTVNATAPQGSTVLDIVNMIVPNGYNGAVGAVVLIDGHIIDRDKWNVIRPKAGRTVNVRVVPTGGGGKNPLAAILSIAITIAAPYVGAALASSFAFGGVWLGATFFSSATVFSAAFGVVGKLLISALAPPPKPPRPANNPAESPTQFIEGARNQLIPFGKVPVCLGTNRMIPPQAARPFTETIGGQQYVRQLFTWGYGKVDVSDLRIGESPISSFSDFDVAHRLNGDLNQPTELFANAVLQDNFDVLLKQEDGFTLRTSRADSDELVVDFTFQGLVRFSASGKKRDQSVEIDVQFSKTGENDWRGGVPYFAVSPAVFNFPAAGAVSGSNISFRTDLIVAYPATGTLARISGTVTASSQSGATAPSLPTGAIRIARVIIRRQFSFPTTTNEIFSVIDERSSGSFVRNIETASDFVSTQSAPLAVSVSGGGLRLPLIVTGAQTEPLRISQVVRLPEKGQYDVRVRRVSADTDDEKIIDKLYFTSLKSFRFISPVGESNVSGTAVRIRATNQLAGALETFNALVSSIVLDYDAETDTWIERKTSNPASLYRYVLQGSANAKALPDSKIDIPALQEWHIYCQQQGYTYNRVIDYETSVAEVLQDIASAGSASPAIVDGLRSVVVDRVKSDIVQIVTPRNSFEYSGEMTYPDPPHAFRVQFRNAEKGYQQDERIVYADGFNEGNATNFETLNLQSCTSSSLAFKIARRFLASVILRPETHTFNMAIENIVCKRGDRIKFVNDVPLIGVGDGRIKSIQKSGDDITGFTIDDIVTIPQSGTYFTRIRLQDGSQIYRQINASVGTFSTFTFAVPFQPSVEPEIGDLCYFVESGKELDLIITRIEPSEDLTARITAIDYAPAIWTAESAFIPPFNSRITTPLEFLRPVAPILLSAQSDETAMQVNSDGSLITRAIFDLQNQNEGDVGVAVLIRESGTSIFRSANVLEINPERVVITGLQDETRYDVHIFYRRGTTYSPALQLNNFLFIGASGDPSDISGFKITVVDDVAVLAWDAVEDIDVSHYWIKFSPVFSGALWDTAQTVEEFVYENRLTIPFRAGTYLIKAVDLSGNRSENATAIITFNPGVLNNQIANLIENPDFDGVKDNAVVTSGELRMADPMVDAFYYFDQDLDLGEIYTSFVSGSIIAGGAITNNVYAWDDVFFVDDIFGAGDNDVFDMMDVFAEEDIFGIGVGAWDVQLQYRVTNSDPIDDDWSAWTELQTGDLEFRAIQFRLWMRSFAQNVTPSVSALSVLVDMPDRILRGEDLTVLAAGVTVTYDGAFLASPAVAITIQDGAADDRIEYTAKDETGFTFRVYNDTLAGYVDRTFDYIASGYGIRN
jgi:hypothetical protein